MLKSTALRKTLIANRGESALLVVVGDPMAAGRVMAAEAA